jgi:hypothetical protein
MRNSRKGWQQQRIYHEYGTCLQHQMSYYRPVLCDLVNTALSDITAECQLHKHKWSKGLNRGFD